MSRQPEPRSQRTSSPDRTVNARQLWSGGAATAVVAALIALAGILVCRWLFGIPVLAPRQDGAWGDASTAGYAMPAGAARSHVALQEEASGPSPIFLGRNRPSHYGKAGIAGP